MLRSGLMRGVDLLLTAAAVGGLLGVCWAVGELAAGFVRAMVYDLTDREPRG